MRRHRACAMVLGLGLMVLAQAGFAGELSKIKPDPDNNGTWTGEGGKDNYIGNCSPCHGLRGRGDGPLADSIGEGVKPRDLSDARLLSARTDDFLFAVIKFGGISQGFSAAMPDWKDTFTDAEIKQIVRYLRTGICKCRSGNKKS